MLLIVLARQCMREDSVFQIVPIASCLGTTHNWKEHGSILFTPSLYVFIDLLMRSSSAIPRMNCPRSVSLSSQKRCCSLLTIFIALHWNLSGSSMLSPFPNWILMFQVQFAAAVSIRANKSRVNRHFHRMYGHGRNDLYPLSACSFPKNKTGLLWKSYSCQWIMDNFSLHLHQSGLSWTEFVFYGRCDFYSSQGWQRWSH